MRTTLPVTALLFLGAFSLATILEPVHRERLGEEHASADVLQVLLGDSRRLFARHAFAKADAYFHRGYYPSIFDSSLEQGAMHIAAEGGGHLEEADWRSEPGDWIARFGRHFSPAEHQHLGHDEEEGHREQEPAGDSAEQAGGGEEREMLPWLRLAAELDPNQVETYVVASYWLRSHLNRPREAEQLLREGLRHNPEHPGLLFELGRIYRENRGDPERARNLWEIALQKLKEGQMEGAEPDLLLHAQLLGNLARLEEDEGRHAEALGYLRELASFSPNREQIQEWIEVLERKGRP